MRHRMKFFQYTVLLGVMALNFRLVICDISSKKEEGYGIVTDKVNELFKHIELGLQFYEINFLKMNVDGLFGLKCLQGDIDYVNNGDLYINGKVLSMPTDIQNKLYSMRMRSQTIIATAKESFIEKSNEYYKKVGFLINNPWRPAVYFRMISPISNWNENVVQDSMKEDDSDNCLKELHDISSLSSDSSSNPCQISDKCLNQMLLPTNISGYSLTHQIFYSTLVGMYSCQTEINRELKKYNKSIYGLQQIYCSNVWNDVQSLLNKYKGRIPSQYQDIYMEQFFVCSTIGFIEFYNETMLSNIYEWQNMTTGCFQNTEGGFIKRKGYKRNILYDSRFKEGCLTHRTSVGLCALSQYLRLYLDTRPSNFLSTLPNYVLDVINERQAYQKRALPVLIQDTLHDTIPLDENDKRAFFVKDHFKFNYPEGLTIVRSGIDQKYDYIDSLGDVDLEKIRQDVVKRRQKEREISLKDSRSISDFVFGESWTVGLMAVILLCICYFLFCRFRLTRYMLFSSCSKFLQQKQQSNVFHR